MIPARADQGKNLKNAVENKVIISHEAWAKFIKFSTAELGPVGASNSPRTKILSNLAQAKYVSIVIASDRRERSNLTNNLFMKWNKISSKSVYKNKFMEVFEDEVKTGLGKHLTFGVVRKKPFALIIPWDGRHLFLVGQYRYPIDKFSWEFPQGHFEHDLISKTAKEELREETGLKTNNMKEVGQLFLAPGHHSQICHVFLATKLSKGKQNLQESEQGMKVKKVTLKQFQNMIIRGSIKDSPTIAAFGMIIAKHLF